MLMLENEKWATSWISKLRRVFITAGHGGSGRSSGIGTSDLAIIDQQEITQLIGGIQFVTMGWQSCAKGLGESVEKAS